MRGGSGTAPEISGAVFACRPDTLLCAYTFLVIYVLRGPSANVGGPLYPFLEVQMRRHSVQKSKSVSSFKGRAAKTDKINVVRNRRGGIRL